MNSPQSPVRQTDRRPIIAPADSRAWRFAGTRHRIGRRKPSLDQASRTAWLLLGDGRPTLGISRPAG